MQDIYWGSSSTIASTDSADSSIGSFFPIPSKLDKASVLLTIKDSERDSGVIIRVQLYDFRASVERLVLNTRGWVLQEMALSHCTVHCMRLGLY